jgi:hypothetical protein
MMGRQIISIVDDDSDNVLMHAALYASANVMELLLKKGDESKIAGTSR